MDRCHSSAVAGACCGRPSLWSLLWPPDQWTVASGSRGPSSFFFFTEGERIDADASCWRRDDRALDRVEVECAILSSWSTSSHHCFMAPGDAMELGGCRNNSLAADNTPGDALDGVWDVCTTVCCRAACMAGVTGVGRLGACGVEEAASPSTAKSTEVSARCSTICTIMIGQEIK
jgi:hypothetical protein